MTYIYPLIQTVIEGTVFLMSSTIALTYKQYAIRYRHNGSVLTGYILHDTIEKLLKDGKIKQVSKPNFANGKEFIKIKLEYLNDSRIMEQAKGVSEKLF